MTRREPGFTPDHDTAHLRDRRAALHPHLAAAATGEPIAALEQQAPEDAKKIERNAIGALLIQRIMQRSAEQRPQRGPYGFLYANRIDQLKIPLSTIDQANWTEEHYLRAIRSEILSTITYDLKTELHNLEAAHHPMYERFIQLLDQRNATELLTGGIQTALNAIELFMQMSTEAAAPEAANPPQRSPRERAELVMNSYPLLAKIASEHLDVGLRILTDLGHHPEYFVIQVGPKGQRLELTAQAEQVYHQLKQEILRSGQLDTVTTGCPALVRNRDHAAGNSNAIEQLLQWYGTSYANIMEAAQAQARV